MIHRLSVTGDAKPRLRFHIVFCDRIKTVGRSGPTTTYDCPESCRADALEFARKLELTVRDGTPVAGGGN